MIAELLKRWSELEPLRCRTYQGGLDGSVMYEVSMTIEQRSGWVAIGSFKHIKSMTGLAVLQYALQQAIAAHNFRLRLENPVGVWESFVFTIDDRGMVKLSPYQQGDEPAISVLMSYVSCLESLKEARQ